MSSASWTPATDASSATWDKNKSRADLERASITYDSSVTDYDSTTEYYDGYNPATYTSEGESGSIWTRVAE